MMRLPVLALSAVLALTPAAAMAQRTSPPAPAPASEADKLFDQAMSLMNSNPVRARELIEQSVKIGGGPEVRNAMAMFLIEGIGGPADRDRGMAMREEAAAAGSLGARLSLGRTLFRRDDAASKAKGVQYMESALAAGPSARPLVVSELGVAYLFGQGVPQDLAKGMDYLEEAVRILARDERYRADYVGALYLVARGNQQGWGGRPVNLERAAEYFRMAGDGGMPAAMWYYGMALVNGQGVGRDSREAYRWFRRSGEAGHADGQISTAVMLATGDGVTENDAEAREWYMRAVNQGSAHAMTSLGGMYLSGEGGPQDMVTGLALLEMGFDGNDQRARDAIGRLPRPTPEMRIQIDEAKARLRRSIRPPR